MKDEDFCRAFCAKVALREIPIGYVFRTPFVRTDGDALAVYLRKSDDGAFRLEDDGQTMGALEAAGFDTDSESRSDALGDLLQEHGAYYDDTESVIYTLYHSEQDIPFAALKFATLLIRLPDLLFLTTTRTRRTFRDDLVALVERQFGSEARIELNSPLQDSMKDYPVDIILRSMDGHSLAIFASTSEMRALEALLFWKEYRHQDIQNVRSLLMLETAQPREMKARTFSRIMNSGIILASMDGEEIAIREKMSDNLLS